MTAVPSRCLSIDLCACNEIGFPVWLVSHIELDVAFWFGTGGAVGIGGSALRSIVTELLSVG